MKFVVFVLFLATFQCAPSEDWVKEMNQEMQKMNQQLQESQRELQQRLRESQKHMQQQLAESQKRMHESQQQLQQNMRETQQHVQQQMKDAQKRLQESRQLMQKSIQQAQDPSNLLVTRGSTNSYVINSNMGTSVISGIGPDGHHYHNTIEDRIVNNIQYRTITHYNATSNKMEMTYYTRDLTNPNSIFVQVNHENQQ